MDTIDSSTTRQTSRRAVLIGGAALGAAGAAAVLTRGQPAAAQALIPGGPPKARVGATFDLFPFAPGTTFPEAIREWNAKTGTHMRCMRVYFQNRKFPTALDPQLKAIRQFRIQALVSFRPAIPTGTNQAEVKADFQHLQNALKLFLRNGLDAEICLYHEVGPRDMTPSQYHTVVKHYGPMVRTFYPLVWNAPGYQPPSVWKPYGEGIQDQLNGFTIDLYCSDFIKHNRKLDPMIELAGDKPVGVWEIGNTDNDKFKPTPTQLRQYFRHIRSHLAEREASKLPVGSVTYFNGPSRPGEGGGNEIVGTHPVPEAPLDIALYRGLYDAVNQVSS